MRAIARKELEQGKCLQGNPDVPESLKQESLDKLSVWVEKCAQNGLNGLMEESGE